MDKTINKMTYTKLDPREAVLNAPEMYAGSMDQEKRKEFHYVNSEDGPKIKLDFTTVPFALIHIFKECCSNVADNCVRSREANMDPGQCIIKVKGNTISVKSFGMPISITFDEKHQQMVPYYIFSDLHSGSNFMGKDEKRTGGGRHGLGIKLGNILSQEFKIAICNAQQGKRYQMSWYNNRSKEGKEIIDDEYNGKESSVTITYKLDMERFGYIKNESYNESALAIMKWVAACLSFTAEIPVVFNNDTLTLKSIKKFASLYILDGKLGKHILYADDNTKLIAIDAPNMGKQISFANSIITHSGGIHVNNALRALTQSLMVKKESKDEKYRADVRDFKRHILLIVSCVNIDKPKWGNGQTKSKLDGPTNLEFNWPEDTAKKIGTWSLGKMIEASVKAKLVDKMFSESKGKVKHIGKVKGKDANWAGHPTKSHLTCLTALEGGSAAQYEKELLNHDPNGRDVHGVIELRGKPKNVMKMKNEIVVALKNKEIRHIIERLNLNPKLDYRIEKNFKTLRYGKFRIMTDPDPDGFHISGIILVLFQLFFPTLLMRNDFIYEWFRPIYQVTRKEKIFRFYSRKEYNEWAEVTPNYRNWDHRYFKGLGSCTPEDIALDYHDHREILMKYDKAAAEKLIMAFGKENDRKEWISNWIPEEQGNIPTEEMKISEFVDWYIREYSYDTLARNLPGIDGLTRVRRKIVFTAFKTWGRQCTSTKKMKIQPNFAGDVGTKTKYHQGDSIPGAVIGLAQTFGGSNNLNLLTGFGAFGSIDGGMKDASQPRYLEVAPRKFLPLIFRPEDDKCLIFKEDDGETIEPKFYLPIIPFVLCNGIAAVGMGWSSTIANYHPLEIIDSYLDKLQYNIEFRELTPWYRNRPGELEIQDDTMYNYGTIEKIAGTSCIVTSLPVGLWHKAYEKKLDKWIQEGKLKDYDSHCTATKTRYTLKGIQAFDNEGNPRAYTMEDIGLVNSCKLTNMTIVNEKGNVVTYKNIKQFLEGYYDFRLPYYLKRKTILLQDIQKAIDILLDRQEYVRALNDGRLIVDPAKGESLKTQQVLDNIKALGLRTDFYKKNAESHIKLVSSIDRSIEEMEKLAQSIEKERGIYNTLDQITHQQLWITDLQELKKEYVKEYGNDQRIILI